MAKINTVFGFTDNITNPLKRMNQALKNTEKSFNAVQVAIITANSAMSAFTTVKGVFDKLSASILATTQAYQYQAEQELKLETIMKQRMNASQADIQAIKNLASAEQQLGIYGDEMILQGAQELASFTSNRKAIETLIPAMNDLIAQQYGYKASGMDFQHTADMMGKVLSGQTGALSKMGYVFSEEEKQMLTMGNEMQRASTLAKIITDNVGHMNHALAGTDAGKIQNINMMLGDLKETIGKTLLPLQSAMKGLQGAIQGDTLKQINKILEAIVPIVSKIINNMTKIYQIMMKIHNLIISKIKGVINNLIQNIIKNLNALAVSLAFIGSTFAMVGTIWVITHAKMLAVTVAHAVKTLAIWISLYREMIAIHLKAMITTVKQWAIANAPIVAIIAIIGLLIWAWVKVGMTFEKVGREIGKVFGWIYAQGYNWIMKLINVFIELQNKIAETAIGKKLGMNTMELKELKDVQMTMNAGAEKGAGIGKQMDNWVKDLQSKLSKNNITSGIEDAFNFNGSGAMEVSDKALTDVADDWRELLMKKATERFNLQYSKVTPSINIDSFEVHKDADSDNVVNKIINMLNQASGAYLR